MSTIQKISESFSIPERYATPGLSLKSMPTFKPPTVKVNAPKIDAKVKVDMKPLDMTKIKDPAKIKPDGSVVKPDGSTMRQPDAASKDFREPDAGAKKTKSEYGKYVAAAAGLVGALGAAAGYQLSKDGHTGQIKEIKDKDGYVYVKYADTFEMCPDATVSISGVDIPELEDEFGIYNVISSTEIQLNLSSEGITFPDLIPVGAKYQYHIGVQDAITCAPGTVKNAMDSLIMTICDKLGLDFDKIKEYARYALYIIIAIIAYKIYKMVV